MGFVYFSGSQSYLARASCSVVDLGANIPNADSFERERDWQLCPCVGGCSSCPSMYAGLCVSGVNRMTWVTDYCDACTLAQAGPCSALHGGSSSHVRSESLYVVGILGLRMTSRLRRSLSSST